MYPLNRLVSEVFAVAKHDLKPGEVLDSIGGVHYYSLIDTYDKARSEKLLPIGLAKNARIIRPVAIDTPITLDDVQLPPSTILELRLLQDAWMAGTITEMEMLAKVDALALD